MISNDVWTILGTFKNGYTVILETVILLYSSKCFITAAKYHASFLKHFLMYISKV